MSTTPIKIAKTGYIVLSVAFCVLGILLMFFPAFSAELACNMLGVAMIAFGVIKIIGYFSKDLYRLAFQFDLAIGLLFAVMGILILVYPTQTMAFFSVVVGLAIMADGLIKIQISLDSRRFGLEKWWMMLALAIVSGIAAAILIFYPHTGAQVITTLLGLALFFEGVQNLIVALFAIKIINHQLPDIDF